MTVMTGNDSGSASTIQILNISKKLGRKKAAAPILKKRHRKYFLRFSYTEDVLLTNAPVKEQIICSVDLELNTDTVYTIMRSDGTVLGRKFISVEKTPTSASGK